MFIINYKLIYLVDKLVFMVYIKCLELINFKFFGGIIIILLLLGFIVVFGLNGFGKFNIFDVFLFCLGLFIFKGMRVEWLLDLVNNRLVGCKIVEIIVIVIFNLEDFLY